MAISYSYLFLSYTSKYINYVVRSFRLAQIPFIINVYLHFFVVVLKDSELGIYHVGKGEDDMGAETGVNVLRIEGGRAGTVLGPVGVVAHTYQLPPLHA